ncbi:MAG: DegT/DnrJ/EryC1/StrS family aminotransferase [Nitrospinaceae bacterium]
MASIKKTSPAGNPVRTKDRFLAFGSPVIEQDEIDEIVSRMKSGWLGTGPMVERFETAFRDYKGGGHPVAVNSCTAGIHLSLIAAGLKPGDEVITTPLTFCATVNAIIHCGATPVLADIDPSTMNIDPAQVEAKVTPNTKVILPVHFAGRPCDMEALEDIAKRHRLTIIEDCAHAIETEYKGRKAGTIGDFGCFSFYVTKNIITGEGGMILTKNPDSASRMKTLSLHGMSKDAWSRFKGQSFKHYTVTELGFKYNMTDLQASIGVHQLKRIEKYSRRREEIWNQYNRAFAKLPLTLPQAPEPETRHAYHLYTILVDEKKTGIRRDDFLDAMMQQNIGISVHYLSIPEHPFYQDTFGWKPEDYPHAMQTGRQTVSLPLSAKLTVEDADDVIAAVEIILNKTS